MSPVGVRQRENCDCTLGGLRRTVPLAIAAVERSTGVWGGFKRSVRVIEAYRDELKYGCEEFKNGEYRAHRTIEVVEKKPQ